MSPTEVDLRELRKVANEACACAADPTHRTAGHPFHGEAVNWADLSCVAAWRTIDDQGYSSLAVEIGEAAPTCPNLCSFIAHYLKQRGFGDVEVRTSW